MRPFPLSDRHYLLLCPITAKVKGYPFEVELPDSLKISGAVLSDQIKSLDWKVRKAKRIALAPQDVLDEVLEVLDLEAGKASEDISSPGQAAQQKREMEDVKAILSAWGRRQQEIANESEKQRRAHEAKKARRAAELKKAWEAKLPDVPKDILTCWKP